MKYEHKIIFKGPGGEKHMRVLDDLSSQGWELVSHTFNPQEDEYKYSFIFRRSIDSEFSEQ